MNTVIMVVVLMASIGLPMSFAVAMVFWQKRLQKREGRRSPLTDKLAHLPGEQLRRRMGVLGDLIDERVVQLLIIGPIVLLIILLPRVNWSAFKLSWLDWLVIVAAFGMTLLNIKRVVPLWRERRQCKQGMLAEIAVAQQLDRLQAQDCLVVHDIPAGNFNIDHVVIGPHAVFMVETKSRLKKGDGKASANVTYDGKALQFPGWMETKPVEQARAQARWLAEYLGGETGEPTPVIPVVCLPGWFVTLGKDAHRSDVRVLNPKMTNLFLEARSRQRFETSRRNRIVTALYKRYPELDAI
ncbi:nuclease-related domain-containing protein [Thermomonas sp.]|uniref:nuclease-related domain-containing protein n=1 Tax=Thermomonas sp. TaxID=1971895 RepID=UPI00248A76BB|nr:nuclease-related domain-containing protein [Thermomonas sp.]MDI1253193.1 nuclease-related domain-containing protein [Thermomonas sp.]